MKQCNHCHLPLPDEAFSPSQLVEGARPGWCRACRREGNRRTYLRAGLEQRRTWTRLVARLVKFGVSGRSLTQMAQRQNWVCACCKVTRVFDGKPIDTQMETNARGVLTALLCYACWQAVRSVDRHLANPSAMEHYLRGRRKRTMDGPLTITEAPSS